MLEEVKSFKYLGFMITNDGSCNVEIKARIGTATTVVIKLKMI